VYVVPFHVYGVLDVIVELPIVVLLLIVKFNVAVFAQPDGFNDV
jgi:hypothetical protein